MASAVQTSCWETFMLLLRLQWNQRVFFVLLHATSATGSGNTIVRLASFVDAYVPRKSSSVHKGGTSYTSNVILRWVFLGLVEDFGSRTPCCLSQADIEDLKI